MKTIICEKQGPYLRCTLAFSLYVQRRTAKRTTRSPGCDDPFRFIKRRTKKAKQLSRTKNKDKSQLLRYTMAFVNEMLGKNNGCL